MGEQLRVIPALERLLSGLARVFGELLGLLLGHAAPASGGHAAPGGHAAGRCTALSPREQT
jgi:hypothetical protein